MGGKGLYFYVKYGKIRSFRRTWIFVFRAGKKLRRKNHSQRHFRALLVANNTHTP